MTKSNYESVNRVLASRQMEYPNIPVAELEVRILEMVAEGSLSPNNIISYIVSEIDDEKDIEEIIKKYVDKIK